MKEQENEGMTEQGMRQRGPISWIMEVGWGGVGWGRSRRRTGTCFLC